MEPRIEFARSMARKYLRRHGVTSPPVPVEEIVVVEGIRVEWTTYPDGTTGESWREGEEGHIALVREMPRPRIRFTLAHELGHLCLRHHEHRFRHVSLTGRGERFSGRGAERDAWTSADPLEIEANQFAAELLMPLGLFLPDWQARRDVRRDVRRLARRYEVSEEAVWWRIRGLTRGSGF